MAIMCLATLLHSGCRDQSPTKQQPEPTSPKAWRITELQDDRGHDTIKNDDGLTYHNYFWAVVLKNDGEEISLLYENALPENLDLKIGQTYKLDGLETANYSDDWHGYWIHDSKLTPLPGK